MQEVIKCSLLPIEDIVHLVLRKYQTDSGVVLGIPNQYQPALKFLLKEVGDLARAKGNCRTCGGTGRLEVCPSCGGSGWRKEEDRDWLD